MTILLLSILLGLFILGNVFILYLGCKIGYKKLQTCIKEYLKELKDFKELKDSKEL